MRCFLLTLVALLPLQGQALDLTPTETTRELEGMRIPIVSFMDGAKKVRFQPPGGWNVAGGTNLLTLSPVDRAEVVTQFRVTSIRPADPAAPEDGDAWCRQYLPKDATKLALDGQNVSPFTLHALPSHEYLYTYVSQGQRFSSSVSVVDLTPRERLSIVISSKVSDFKAAREEVFRSLFTMDWGD